MLVSQSAIGFYGDRGEALVDESAGPGEGFDAEVVVEWEKAAREIESSGVRLVMVRTGHVLDPGAGLLGQLLTPFKLGVGGPIAGGEQYMSWIHIDDEVGLLLWALDEQRCAARSTPQHPTRSPTASCQRLWGRARPPGRDPGARDSPSI